MGRSAARPRRLRSALAALACLTALAAPAGASASESSTILDECAHGKSVAGFKQAAYRKALKELPEYARQYSECEQLIRKAQLEAAGGRAGGGGAGAPAIPLAATPTEQRAIARATHLRPGPIAVGNKFVVPGVMHANIASVFSTLPTPLLATVIFLIACALAAAGNALRDRVSKRRGI